MGLDQPLDQVLRQIHEMDRTECIEQLLNFEQIRLDFNATFLNQMSSDRLRHILLAAVITVRRRKAG